MSPATRCVRCEPPVTHPDPRDGDHVPHPDPRDGTCQPCTNRDSDAGEVLAHLSELLADLDASLRDLETTVDDMEVHAP